jgi:RNA polymerase sigma-70 factor (ECF subfamily)
VAADPDDGAGRREPPGSALDADVLVRLAAARWVPRDEHDRVVRRFAAAAGEGDVAGLRRLLCPDVLVVSDGGGAVPEGATVVSGADDAAWLVAALLLRRPGVDVTVAEVNGRSGLVVRRGPDAVAVVAPGVTPGVVPGDAAGALAGRIAAVWVVRNPAKLRAWHLCR